MRKVLELNQEIKQALEAEKVRLEAPIPGTKYIGVEVPKKERKFLKFEPSLASEFKLPIGKGIDGNIRYADLTDSNNAHILVVGQTGSGKTEALRVFIESLQGKAELYLVDPKRTELLRYKDIAKWYDYADDKVATMVDWQYAQMMSRYEKFAKIGVGNIDEYNKKSKVKEERRIIVIEEYANIKL